MAPRPPLYTLFPYTTLFRSVDGARSAAKVAVGGERVGGELAAGYFVQPTVVTGVRNDMPVAREEVFGPVLSVIPFEDVDRSEEHTSELQSQFHLVCRLLLEK